MKKIEPGGAKTNQKQFDALFARLLNPAPLKPDATPAGKKAPKRPR